MVYMATSPYEFLIRLVLIINKFLPVAFRLKKMFSFHFFSELYAVDQHIESIYID